jgi:hypothetical protein
MIVAFAQRRGVDLRASTLLGVSAADRSMASVLDIAFADA